MSENHDSLPEQIKVSIHMLLSYLREKECSTLMTIFLLSSNSLKVILYGLKSCLNPTMQAECLGKIRQVNGVDFVNKLEQYSGDSNFKGSRRFVNLKKDIASEISAKLGFNDCQEHWQVIASEISE